MQVMYHAMIVKSISYIATNLSQIGQRATIEQSNAGTISRSLYQWFDSVSPHRSRVAT